MTGFLAGDRVQTPLGKGTVGEVRRNGRVLVQIQGRAVVFQENSLTQLDAVAPTRRTRKATVHEAMPDDTPTRRHDAATEVDLHGLTVEEALVRAGQALNDAMLADLPELRLIHGRSGGRIKAALHRHLRGIGAVRGLRLDPRNPGVTIVSL